MTPRNQNGPAEAATSPDRGSINPAKDMKMNRQIDSTASVQLPALSTKLVNLEDILGEARSFTQAVFLAAAGLGSSSNTCALQVLAEQINARLEQARCVVDEIRENAQ